MNTIVVLLEACCHSYRIEYRDQGLSSPLPVGGIRVGWTNWRPLNTAVYLDLDDNRKIPPLWHIWTLLDSMPDRLVGAALDTCRAHIEKDIHIQGSNIRFELRAVAIEDPTTAERPGP